MDQRLERPTKNGAHQGPFSLSHIISVEAAEVPILLGEESRLASTLTNE